MKKRIMQISSILLMTGLVSACSYLPGLHRTVVMQGNQVEEIRLEQIKPGMPHTDVQRILGTPLVRDPYNPHVWHYTYIKSLSTGEVEDQQNVKIVFNDKNLVESVERTQ